MARPQLFDTHVHLDCWPSPALEKELDLARRAGVEGFVVPGVERADWPKLIRLARAEAGVWAAPGLHPLAAGQWNEAAGKELEGLLADPAVIAVGEIGLDGLIEVPPEVQERALRGQLKLAVAAGLPVLIHCRKATERMFTVLREERADQVGGVLHAFSGSVETARQAVDLGFAIGFGGTLTYPNARRALAALRNLPEEAILLETDAPDIPPHPHRGEENRPSWLPLIAHRVAEIRGWDEGATARITTANARRVFRL